MPTVGQSLNWEIGAFDTEEIEETCPMEKNKRPGIYDVKFANADNDFAFWEASGGKGVIDISRLRWHQMCSFSVLVFPFFPLIVPIL